MFVLLHRADKIHPWKYNIRRNVNSDFSIVPMSRVAVIVFELGTIKTFRQKFYLQDTSWLFFCLDIVLDCNIFI